MGHHDDTMNKFQAFDLSTLEQAASVLRLMRKRNVAVNDFLAAVEAAVEKIKENVHDNARPETAILGKASASGTTGRRKQRPARPHQGAMQCPKCGNAAFAQPVCPNCAKGRAGIRREYICGECNFVFYID